jgi:hypothetical protein
MAFSGLKDSVWRQIYGWKEKLLSKVGREILIKAVAQSIPTYTMSCFKLPDSLYSELNSMYRNFWWGQKCKSKNAHWVKWSKLCSSKDSSGLGFRDIKVFNMALLAKQGWRLLQQPNSLVFRVLKAKYFPSCDFMDADVGRKPSYAWRSIALAREVLRLGLCWHVGDGRQICIWRDPWLPLAGSRMVHSKSQVLPSTATVSELIDVDTRQWRFCFIKEIFSNWDAKAILSIQLAQVPRRDSLFWNATSTGVFSVKSAYHVWISHQAKSCLGETSVVGQDKAFWKYIWALSIPPKTKSFLWRACLGILPTNELKAKRHMRGEDNCQLCSGESESVVHSLWACPWANAVWALSPLRVLKWDRCVPSFCDLLLMARARLGVEEVEMFACITYFLWHQRNLFVHEDRGCEPENVVHKALHLIQGFRESKSGGFVRAQVIHRPNCWSPPPVGLYKLNWEVVVSSTKEWWVGVLVRDSDGFVLAATCAKLPQHSRRDYLWFSGALYALKFLIEVGFFDIIFEGSLSIHSAKLSQPPSGSTIQDMWLEDVWGLLQKFRSYQISSVPVESNIGAMQLAKLGFKLKQTTVWLEEVPVGLQGIM